jgi:DNA-binding GntR family transcriptional regulator
MREGEARNTEASQGRSVYERLVDEIRKGQLRPSDRLTETELATRFGISRTPVREAIRHLEADGLVVHNPRVGTVVRSLGYPEVNELYEMRTVLEGTAARFAARSASAIELAELAAINDEMTKALGDATKLFDANKQFHELLLDVARNRFLISAAESVQKTLLILGPSTMEEEDRAAVAVAEHRAVIDALHAHDGEEAETAMRVHIEGAHRARLRQIRLTPAA